MIDVMVLCYHAVSPTWRAPLSVTPEQLERQLSWLTRQGWTGTTFGRAVLDPPHRRTLAITFDDAYSSVFDLARPILASLDLPATLFVPTSFPDSGSPLRWPGIVHWADTPHAGELECLTWAQIGQLEDEGWEIGSHTRTHPSLTTLGAEELRTELAESRAECDAHLRSECVSIAYPYGDVDSRVAEAAVAAGYEIGASMSSHLGRLGPLRWPRLGIYQIDGTERFRLKTTRPMRWLRGSRLWANDEHP